MGRSIYMTDRETEALISAAEEWSEIMSSGDEDSAELAEERLSEGLGSALKKLYKCRKKEKIYGGY